MFLRKVHSINILTNSFMRSLLDLLFPPRCIYCNNLVKSSQTFACSRCLASLSWISPEGALLQGTHFSYCVSCAWYEGAIRDAFLQYKFEGQPQYAKAFADPLAEAISQHFEDRFDLLSWVPLSQKNLESRGYDQAFLLSSAVAHKLQRNPLPLLKKTSQKELQSSLSSAQARRNNVKGSFSLIDPFLVQGKRILIIDDVITTGSTLEEAAEVLLRADAKEVLCATFCRTPLTSHFNRENLLRHP